MARSLNGKLVWKVTAAAGMNLDPLSDLKPL